MDAIQAAVLDVKLGHLDAWNRERQELAQRYQEELANLDIRLPQVAEYADPVWHLFVTRCRNRDGLMQGLAHEGIQTGLHYPVPVHLQAAVCERSGSPAKLPVTEEAASTCLSLPLFPGMSDVQLRHVVAALQRLLDSAPGAVGSSTPLIANG